jgi:hypothetical protein
VRSTQKPNIGSRNYATAIQGVTMGGSGGQLGVISDDSPDFSTLDYTSDGEAALGAVDVKLVSHSIAVLSDPPMYITDGNGKIAITERSQMGGNIALVFGAATSPVGLQFAATPVAIPDAIAFTGNDIVIAAGATLYTVQASPTPVACVAMDNTNMALSAAALASDGTNLWVWSKAGALFSYPITALAPCNGGMVPAPGNAFTTTGFMPGNGARIHIVGTYAILTAHAGSSRMGQVFVVDLATLAAVGTPVSVDGIKNSTIAVLGGKTYLVLGIPDRAVEGVAGGQVELREFDTATGIVGSAPALLLNDAQPESGGLFGRSVTTMKFNDQTILVVAGDSEVFAYYKTALYDALP